MLGFGKKKTTKKKLDTFELPSFSSAVLSLLNKLRDPSISSNELAHDLEVDPGLHVRVLKTVNSAAFGLSHKVSNIQHAVNLLGRGRLESLVLSVAVKDSVSRDNALPWLNMQKFWSTASFRASLSRCLATILHPNIQSDVFTIGLLQDMAVPVLASRKQDRYQELYLTWLVEPDFNLIEQEQQCFGINHADLGAQMAESWGFPASLVEAIRCHHQEESSSEVPLAVQIAALIRNHPDSDKDISLAERILAGFTLDANMLETQLTIAREESRELSRALS